MGIKSLNQMSGVDLNKDSNDYSMYYYKRMYLFLAKWSKY